MKGFLSRSFFFKLLSTLLLIIIFQIHYIAPAQAISTLSKCAASPSCAATLVSKTGARNVITNGASKSVARKVTGSIVKKTGTQAVELSWKSHVKSFMAELGVEVFANHILSDENVDKLRETAKNRFCSTFKNSCEGYKLTFTTISNSTTTVYAKDYIINPVDAPYSVADDHVILSIYPYSGKPYAQEIFEGSLIVEPISGLPWVDPFWDLIKVVTDKGVERAREAAADLIKDDEYAKEFTPDEEVKADDDTLEINLDVDFIGEDGDGNPTLKSPFNFNKTTNNNGGSGTGGSGSGDGESGDGTGGSGSNEETDGSDNDNQETEEEEAEEEETEEEETEEETDLELEEIEFSEENFFEYAIGKFITEPKFPFDIFGTLPTAEDENKCPKISFFGREREVCEVNDTLKVTKYPIWIAWMFRLVFSL